MISQQLILKLQKKRMVGIPLSSLVEVNLLKIGNVQKVTHIDYLFTEEISPKLDAPFAEIDKLSQVLMTWLPLIRSWH
jgi:hypothetical protein